MTSNADDVSLLGDVIMKAIYRAIRKSIQQLQWMKGLSLLGRSKSQAQQQLEEIIQVAHEGIGEPQGR